MGGVETDSRGRGLGREGLGVRGEATELRGVGTAEAREGDGGGGGVAFEGLWLKGLREGGGAGAGEAHSPRRAPHLSPGR